MANTKVDHIAIVVKDLKTAIEHFTSIGFILKQNVTIEEQTPGTISAIVVLGEVRFVLLQSPDKDTCLTRHVDDYGYGVHHIALQVSNFESVYAELKNKDIQFQTKVARSRGLTQVLGQRDSNSGIMVEIIERKGEFNYELSDGNINTLLQDLG